MKKNLFLLAAMFCMAIHSFATTHTITVADFTFSPTPITVNLGDTVKWVWASGTHTTTSTTIPTGATTWNSSITSSSTTFIYVPTVTGTYNYECSIHAGMGMVGIFTVVSASGVNDVNKTAIVSVYPNPASGTLHVQFNTPGSSVSVTMTDMNGKQVFKKKFRSMKNTDIDLANIPNGTYILHAQQGTETYNQQMLVAH